MNILKLFLILCASITIVYFTWIGIIFVGLLTIGYFSLKYLINKTKHKIHNIFN